MASKSEYLVSLLLTLNDKLTKPLNEMDRKLSEKLKKMGESWIATGKKLTKFVTVPILAIGAAFSKAAIDAEETASKFEAVYYKISVVANKTADNLSENFGLSDDAAKELLSTTGDLLTGFQFSQEQALMLSNEVAELGVDLNSFTNFAGGAKGAVVALTKALLGETEQAKALGIVIRQDSDEFRELVKHFMEVEGMTLLQAKAMTALEIATKQSQNAIGDYKRTSESTANQIKLTMQDLNDLAVSFGKLLLPVVNKVTKVVRGIIGFFENLDDSTKNLIVSMLGLAAAIGPLMILGGKLLVFFSTPMTPIQGLIIAIGALSVALITLNEIFAKAETAHLDRADAIQDEIDETENLREEYDKLSRKAVLNNAEKQRMITIETILKKRIGETAFEIDQQTGKLRINTAEFEKNSKRKKELILKELQEQLKADEKRFSSITKKYEKAKKKIDEPMQIFGKDVTFEQDEIDMKKYGKQMDKLELKILELKEKIALLGDESVDTSDDVDNLEGSFTGTLPSDDRIPLLTIPTRIKKKIEEIQDEMSVPITTDGSSEIITKATSSSKSKVDVKIKIETDPDVSAKIQDVEKSGDVGTRIDVSQLTGSLFD